MLRIPVCAIGGRETVAALLLAVLCLALAGGAHAAPGDACAVTPRSPLVVSVKDKGAKGDGVSDDTDAIARAIEAVAGTGGTVYVPEGTYMVRAAGEKTLQLRSRMVLKLADKAVLKVIPNGESHYALLTIDKASDVAVTGGTLRGDRKDHKGKQGEWGMGVWIGKGAARVTIAGVTAKEFWGDGIYIRGADGVAICGVASLRNRRQGLSIVDGKNILVTGSSFRDTAGTAPSAGIDIEPNRGGSVTNVAIERSEFIDNAGGGIMISGKKGDVAKVKITDNVFQGSERPVLVENAPHVRSSQICKNRYTAKQAPAAAGLNSFAEPVDMVALQGACEEGRDLRFETNRGKKK